MANQAIGETGIQTINRIFEAPRALVWKAWTIPEYVMKWWGPQGFTSPVCRIDLRVGGRFTYSMRSPDGHVSFPPPPRKSEKAQRHGQILDKLAEVVAELVHRA